MTPHFKVSVAGCLVFSAVLLSNFHVNGQTRAPQNSSPHTKLTVIIIRVKHLLPVSIVVPPPLPILVSSTRLPIESLLFQDLLFPWRRRCAGVVVETWEEVWDLWDGEDGTRAHIDGKVLLHRDLDRRRRGKSGGVGRCQGGGGRWGRGGGGGRGDGQVGGGGGRRWFGDAHKDCQTELWGENASVREKEMNKVRKIENNQGSQQKGGNKSPKTRREKQNNTVISSASSEFLSSTFSEFVQQQQQRESILFKASQHWQYFEIHKTSETSWKHFFVFICWCNPEAKIEFARTFGTSSVTHTMCEHTKSVRWINIQM